MKITQHGNSQIIGGISTPGNVEIHDHRGLKVELVAWQETDVYGKPLWDKTSFSQVPDSFAYQRALYAEVK